MTSAAPSDALPAGYADPPALAVIEGGTGSGMAEHPWPSRAAFDAWVAGLGYSRDAGLAGAWALVLSRYAGAGDVAFGVRCARADDHRPLASCVRMQVDPATPLLEWIGQAAAALADGAGRPAGPPPLETALMLDDDLGLPETGGAGAAVPPLTIGVAGETLRARYEGARYDGQAVARLVAQLATLLDAMAAGSPQRPVGSLPMLTPDECAALARFNETARPYPADATLDRLLEVQAVRSPDAIALMYEGTHLTYAELHARANQLAHHLRTLGVGRDRLVGIFLERSVEMVVALLGTLKAGGAYVPIDPGYPEERIAFMLQDAAPLVLLTQERLTSRLPSHGAPILCLDSEWDTIASRPGDAPAGTVMPSDLAYVIYTSGSTGRPKGAMNTHAGICNRLLWMQEAYGLGPDDRVMQKTPFSFDVSVWEFFWPLITGAGLVVARPEGHKEPAYLARVIEERGVTIIHFVPSMLQAFLATAPLAQCRSLRTVICSGEELTHDLQERFFAGLGAELHNLYGPTEAAVDVTAWTCVRGGAERAVPIGRPIANTTIAILDADGNPTPIGLAGELYIGGVQVGRGYLNRPELTAERFLPDPAPGLPSGRRYRTGDLARWRPDGAIEFLGRLDHQVKIHGFRIELGEIEAVLKDHPAVADAVVIAREDAPGHKRLVGYVVAELDGMATTADTEQVTQWRSVYDETYAGEDQAADPTFNIVGWNSSYTDAPISAEEMRQWVDQTVERILAFRPRRVLEIGCGTGLLLYRVAPHCERYDGWDLSGVVIDQLRHDLTRDRPALPHVQLSRRPADDFSGVEPDSYDGVVINSVVQLFPGVGYLLRVIEEAARAVRPGGFILVGDVRSLPLHEAFHASVQLFRAEAELPLRALADRIRSRVTEDEELVLDPEFFSALRTRIPTIGGVTVQLKRGTHANELTRFRYDAVLHVGVPSRAAVPATTWDEVGGSIEALRAYLAHAAVERVRITGIPNARTVDAVVAVRGTFQEGPRYGSAGELRQGLSERRLGAAVEPEQLWGLAAELGYDAVVTWSAEPDRVDAILVRHGATGDSAPSLTDSAEPPHRSVGELANDPLRRALTRRLLPRLREYLASRLPAHMVPGSVVFLDAMPLSPNGKLDRRALPAPVAEREGFVPPRTPTEESLAAIWAEALGLERVGIEDDFFSLGGDSILSIQIIGRARLAGIEVTHRQMFEHPTIERLARVATRAKGTQVDQGVVTGPVALMPYQAWLLGQNLPDPHHWNMSVLVRPRSPIDGSQLAGAVADLLAHHDALRLRFRRVAGRWEAVHGEVEAVPVERIDLSSLLPAKKPDALAHEAARLQASLDLERGPLVRVGWFVGAADDGDRVLLVAHHLIVDAVSWQVLLEDLERALVALGHGQPTRLPPKTTSWKDWAERLNDYANRTITRDETDYWRSVARARARFAPAVDARDRPPDLEGDERVLRVTLTADETRALLQDVPRAYGSQINDALLAGLVPVLAEWHGGAADPSGAVWIDLEGHGREDVVEGVDVSRTVSCFTTVFPVALRAGGAAPGDRLRSVKEQLRAVPHRGLGYGLLRYLRGDEVAADLAGLPPSAVMFNYLGRLDPLGTESLLALVPETVGPEHSPKAPRTHRLLVNASVADGRLRVDWHHNPALDPTATIATLADRFLDELRSIVAHCATGARGYTPSDFSLIRIDQHRLDALVPPGDTVEDIYPLTPIQEGMLLHYRLDPDSPAYRVQWSGDLAGPLDAHALERAWAAVVARHPALRARFAWDGLDEPLQVVERVAHLPFTHHDWRALSPEDREHRLAQITSDRHWDVDPRRAPLMAITLARLDDELHHFAWRFHHLPIDGWTMALLLREALEIYQALRNGRTPELPPPVPYRVFLEWLGRRDHTAAEEFWRSELADFAEPTPLPGDRGAGSDERPAYESRRATLDLGETTALLTLARDRQLTLGTLLHGAWALALAHNSGRDDVVFGNIVTGRPPELPGVESIVGLLLNSVPVRIRVPRSGDWARWLAALQARQAESRPFEWAPPVLVQAWSEVPRSRPLYETNVSLQAYAGKGIHDEWRDRLGLRNHRFRDWNPYALSLAAELDPKLVLLAKYDSERVASSAVDEMLDALVGALRALCQDPGGSLADLRGAVNLAVERGRLDRRTASRAERSKTLQGIRRRPAGT